MIQIGQPQVWTNSKNWNVEEATLKTNKFHVQFIRYFVIFWSIAIHCPLKIHNHVERNFMEWKIWKLHLDWNYFFLREGFDSYKRLIDRTMRPNHACILFSKGNWKYILNDIQWTQMFCPVLMWKPFYKVHCRPMFIDKKKWDLIFCGACEWLAIADYISFHPMNNKDLIERISFTFF